MKITFIATALLLAFAFLADFSEGYAFYHDGTFIEDFNETCIEVIAENDFYGSCCSFADLEEADGKQQGCRLTVAGQDNSCGRNNKQYLAECAANGGCLAGPYVTVMYANTTTTAVPECPPTEYEWNSTTAAMVMNIADTTTADIPIDTDSPQMYGSASIHSGTYTEDFKETCAEVIAANDFYGTCCSFADMDNDKADGKQQGCRLTVAGEFSLCGRNNKQYLAECTANGACLGGPFVTITYVDMNTTTALPECPPTEYEWNATMAVMNTTSTVDIPTDDDSPQMYGSASIHSGTYTEDFKETCADVIATNDFYGTCCSFADIDDEADGKQQGCRLTVSGEFSSCGWNNKQYLAECTTNGACLGGPFVTVTYVDMNTTTTALPECPPTDYEWNVTVAVMTQASSSSNLDEASSAGSLPTNCFFTIGWFSLVLLNVLLF